MYGLFATLLDYPDAQTAAALEECLAAAGSEAAELLLEFRNAVAGLRAGRLEEIYAQTFDFEPECALAIGHHLFGEDWRRSVLLATLKQRYAETGLAPGTELPDHLPTVLRFLAQQPAGEESEELVRHCVAPAVARMAQAVEKKTSPYGAVLRALLLYLGPPDEVENPVCRPSFSSSFPILQ